MRVDWWTLALQTVNVLILIWILGRFFFRPVAEIVARRQEEANKVLSDANAAREEAADAREDAGRMRADIAAERSRLIVEARKSAEVEKERLVAVAAEEIAKLRREGEAAITRDRATAEQAIIARAGELAVDIATRLLGRLPPGLGLVAFLDGLNRELRALPREAKQGFMSATADHPIEVVTAVPPSKSEIEDVRHALQEALDSEPPIAFRSDPAVIAGIELHGRTAIVRNSWRADLDRIREELDVGRQRRRS